jgi:DUF1680 family protein
MNVTRRRFAEAAACAGLGVATRLASPARLAAAPPADLPAPEATGERITAGPGSFYRPYFSRSFETPEVSAWVQVDLGSRVPIDTVKLYPTNNLQMAGDGFPQRFSIACADEPEFGSSRLIADRSKEDYPDPGDSVLAFPGQGMEGRYVRLTVSRLRAPKRRNPASALPQGAVYRLGLARIDVVSGGMAIAARCSVSSDPVSANERDLRQITRPMRPMGEGVVTDNPGNVTPRESWRPPGYRAQAPLRGVTLADGVFRKAMDDNIAYLLESFSVDQLLSQFRKRAGKPVPAGLPKPHPFWEEDLAGSNAGRFLMGAGNTVRWIGHPELRARLNAVVEGIAECRQPNGYIMGYPEDTLFVSERAAYTRSWLTHGLIEAGYAGNTKAFELLRGYYDWYNRQTSSLPELLRRAIQGGQGMVANTRMYFTPAGKPADIQVIQRYFQENYWMQGLSQRAEEAVWQYPYDRPHCYLLTNLEAYLDLYRATGDARYNEAAMGAWDLYHHNWENAGASISIIEFEVDPPKSNFLYQKLGENCGSAFWALLNQRFHLLDPDQERYTAEIEKAIYNVLVANQGGSQGIRYHTILLGKKEEPSRINTCCEGQGTRLLGALPEFIYSLASDGVYVNLFEPSTLEWTQSGRPMRLVLKTRFPFSPEVRLEIGGSEPSRSVIRVRVPGWASGAMPIEVNGSRMAMGMPGSYVPLDRVWSPGDAISFTLPMKFQFTRYLGLDQVEDHERYSVEYGPLLMAAVGLADGELVLRDAGRAADLWAGLRPVSDQPLHFHLGNDIEFKPYFQVADEWFSCFPLVNTRRG